MDVELVLRARDGDHDAFAQLAARSIGHLTAIARMILHDEYRAQDAVQDALVDAWRGLRGLRDPERYDAWLRRILVRSCREKARREWRRDTMEVDLASTADPIVAGGHDVVDVHDRLERGLARLSPGERAVLVLTYFVDMPLAEAATTLDIPVGTMKSRLNRALQALRAAIEAAEREPARPTERVR